ncbi:zinc finger protein 446-like [Scophthalmus maximus]|uniref:zinc finger protein 446-like n=1 Tax=Scophthalmus maximus TaxID=52904 RepID=UPI0015E06B03|nr:zinc finger protein 446-like [Scophthalmus maximus]
MQRGAKPKNPQVPVEDQRKETWDDRKQQWALGEQQGLKQQQMDRKAKWEKDRHRPEACWKRIQHQFTHPQQGVKSNRRERQQLVEGAVADPGTWSTSTADDGSKGLKMQPYNNDEAIEHYLTTFERIASARQWPKEQWALHLSPLLSGKPRAAYEAMDFDDTMDYAKVKRAIFDKFEISTETYRFRFRSTSAEEEETPKELHRRLKDLYDKWMVPKEKTKEQIGDAIVMEQFLRVLKPDLRTWVKERYPTTSTQAAELAEAFHVITSRQSQPPPDLVKKEQIPSTSKHAAEVAEAFSIITSRTSQPPPDLVKKEQIPSTSKHAAEVAEAFSAITSRQSQPPSDLVKKEQIPSTSKHAAEVAEAFSLTTLRQSKPPPDLLKKEQHLTTSKHATELPEAFPVATSKQSQSPPSLGKKVGVNGSRVENPKQGPSNRVREFKPRDPSVCHSCGQPGHLKADCPGQQVEKSFRSQKVEKSYMTVSPASVQGRKDEIIGLAAPSNQDSTTCLFIDGKWIIFL